MQKNAQLNNQFIDYLHTVNCPDRHWWLPWGWAGSLRQHLTMAEPPCSSEPCPSTLGWRFSWYRTSEWQPIYQNTKRLQFNSYKLLYIFQLLKDWPFMYMIYEKFNLDIHVLQMQQTKKLRLCVSTRTIRK